MAIEVTDEMVDRATRIYLETDDGPSASMRAALTAALALVTPGAGFRAGAGWAAGVIDRGQQTFSTGGTGPGKRHLSPRAHGNIDGLAYAEAIRTELAALPEGGDEWRPIETHPGDTKGCLIAGKYPNGVAYVEEQFLHHDGHWNSRRLEPPTHWQPMPAPPAISPPLCDDEGGGT